MKHPIGSARSRWSRRLSDQTYLIDALNEAAGGNAAAGRNRWSVGAIYLIMLIEVAIESLAMKAAPHQSEPGPPGLIGVVATPVAV